MADDVGETPMLFTREDLAFFGLGPSDADEAALRKACLRKMLQVHPGKGGSCSAFNEAQARKDKLENGLAEPDELQQRSPGLTVFDVTGPKVASQRVRVVAPTWQATNILTGGERLWCIHAVLMGLGNPQNKLGIGVDRLAIALQALKPGDSFAVPIRHWSFPPGWNKHVKYHGTLFGA